MSGVRSSRLRVRRFVSVSLCISFRGGRRRGVVVARERGLTGQEPDDGCQHRDDAVDDAHDDTGDGVDDRHDTVTNPLDARHDCAHLCCLLWLGFCLFWVGSLWCWVLGVIERERERLCCVSFS